MCCHILLVILMVDMYILLIPLLWTSVISCPFEKFEPIHMYYNGASQMMCIEFDIVLQNSYSDFAIVQNGRQTGLYYVTFLCVLWLLLFISFPLS